MKPHQFIERTKRFAVSVLNMIKDLPKIHPSQVMSYQIVRSATSVAANYRSACRSKSTRDFIYKMKVVEEELDETIYWLELIGETHIYLRDKVSLLTAEANELMCMTVQSLITVRRNQRRLQSHDANELTDVPYNRSQFNR